MIAIYTRVSTDKQNTEGHSIEEQLHLAIEYVKTHCESEEYQVYNDAGLSAAKIKNRPQIMQLIKDIANNMISTVIFWDIPRISRDVTDFNYFMAHCEQYDVQIHCLTMHVSYQTPEEKFKALLIALVSQYEKDKTRQRTKMGIIGGLNKGLYVYGGQAPYGYMRDKNVLLIHEHDANIVKRIFDMYAYNNLSVNYITAHFKQLRIDSSQRKIPITAINELLTNTIYIGRVTHKGITYNNIAPQIISDEQFEIVQQKLKSASHTQFVNKYLFGDKVFCKHCEEKMIRTCTIKKKSKIYRYYMCNNKDCIMRNARINENHMLSYITPKLNTILQSQDWLIMDVQENNSRYEKEIQDRKRYIQNEEKRMTKAFKYLLDGTFSKEDFARAKKETQKAIEHYKNDILILENKIKITALSINELTRTQLFNFISGCPDFLVDLNKKTTVLKQ